MSAASDQQPPRKGPGGGTPPRKDETDLWMLVHEHGVWPRDGARIMGMHHKRLEYLCHKWSAQGKYDYGVTHDLGWSTTRYHQPRGPQIMFGPLAEQPKRVVLGPPPPPPFAGASMAVRVAMSTPERNPALVLANRRAVKAVRRSAMRDAARIAAANTEPECSLALCGTPCSCAGRNPTHPVTVTVPVDPTLSARRQFHHAVTMGLVMQGQVYVESSRPPKASAHATLHADGRFEWNDVAHMPRRGW